MKVAELRGTRDGFTLMEVVLTVMIMSMMLTSITQMLTSVRTSRDTIHNIQETQLAGPAILDQIERDLRAATITNLPLEAHFRVMNRVMYGEDGDSIDFVTSTDSLVWEVDDNGSIRADYNEVGYCLRPNPDNDDFLEMYRREGFGVDEEPFDAGNYIFLHDQVKSFDIEVYEEDGPEAEPVEEWGMDPTSPEQMGFPARIRISLTLELKPRLLREQLAIAPVDKRTVTYRRIIRLPESLRVAAEEIPRFGIPAGPGTTGSDPTAPGPGEDTPDGGGEGGGGGDRPPTSGDGAGADSGKSPQNADGGGM